jgi:acetyltransferase
MTRTLRTLSSDMFQAEASLFSRSGDRIHVRPATPADRPTVAAFVGKLSSEDLASRFQTDEPTMDAAQIEQLCRADYPASMSFLAFHDGDMIALASLTGGEAGKVEVALATLPEWKRHGVSWALLGHIVNYAAEHGASEIVSIEHRGNRAALTLEHEMGFGIRVIDAEAGQLVARKSLK